jgi:hypothetical protein
MRFHAGKKRDFGKRLLVFQSTKRLAKIYFQGSKREINLTTQLCCMDDECSFRCHQQ